jgi:hypothetical protein
MKGEPIMKLIQGGGYDTKARASELVADLKRGIADVEEAAKGKSYRTRLGPGGYRKLAKFLNNMARSIEMSRPDTGDVQHD